jgi:hypothetical protein
MHETVPEDARFPSLAEPYATALRGAVAWITARFDVQGIVFCGSVASGTADASSDLDLQVISAPLVRQRIQKFFGHVPAEVFVNPPVAIRRYFASDHAAGRSHTAHMFGTGVVLLDRDPVAQALITEARGWLARDMPQPAGGDTLARYLAAAAFEDAIDVIGRDPELAALLLSRSVDQMLAHHARRVLGRVPRPKALLGELQAVDAELVGLVRRFAAAPTLEQRLPFAEALADRCLGARGFFEWESPPEAVPPASP